MLFFLAPCSFKYFSFFFLKYSVHSLSSFKGFRHSSAILLWENSCKYYEILITCKHQYIIHAKCFTDANVNHSELVIDWLLLQILFHRKPLIIRGIFSLLKLLNVCVDPSNFISKSFHTSSPPNKLWRILSRPPPHPLPKHYMTLVDTQ